ncbi:MAG: nucleoside 2-deoxyribosyltransferase [Methanomicrobiales archaeon]|nr:nucleoside 2-deoxyribosyltransferase [Methanomicrobiales archaeon]
MKPAAEKKLRVYISGPLFTWAERAFNEQVSAFFEERGYETFLPQRDGLLLADLLSRGMTEQEALERIFILDVKTIADCDLFLFNFDGRVPDEGACVELGIAFAKEKRCIGLKTDCRTLMAGLDNPLLLGPLEGRIARSIAELDRFL